VAYGPEFQEIAHCGGKVIVTVSTDANGQRGVSFGVQHSTPQGAAWFAVYALPQGIPVAMIQLAWISTDRVDANTDDEVSAFSPAGGLRAPL
jgi:hypothetical protein